MNEIFLKVNVDNENDILFYRTDGMMNWKWISNYDIQEIICTNTIQTYIGNSQKYLAKVDKHNEYQASRCNIVFIMCFSWDINW